MDEPGAIVKLLANGVGVALVPQTSDYRRWTAAIRAVDLGQDTFHCKIGLVHRASWGLSEPARMLTQGEIPSFSPK